MKNILSLMFLLMCHFAYAGTGSAKDIEVLYLIIAGVLVVLLAIFLIIGFIRKTQQKRREKMEVLANETNTEAEPLESGRV